MVTAVVMPPAGQISDELRIVKWRKKVGEDVRKGETLFEVATDKAVMEIESYRDGVLLAVLHGEGDVVRVGEVVAYIGERGEQPPDEAGKGEKVFSAARVEEKPTTPLGEKSLPVEGRRKGPLASPLAKRLAQEHRVNLEDVARALAKDVIKKEDVVKFLEGSEWYFVDLSPVRQAIARKVAESVRTIPHYAISVDVDMSACVALRDRLKGSAETLGAHVSYSDIIMKCAARAVESYPLVNATFEGEKARVYRSVNFGLVVDTGEGVVVPVIRGVNRKPLLEVARERMEKVERARSGRLRPDDLLQGTITLSNLGMYGVERFTAVINAPQSAILAVGRIAERPVCEGGRVVPKPTVTITASFDHRLIDGAYGARFLRELKRLLEDPSFLLEG